MCTSLDTHLSVDPTNYIGIDLHSDNIFVCVIKSAAMQDGKVGYRKVFLKKILLRPGLQEVVSQLSPFCSEPHIATVESTYNWYGLADLFEAKGWNLVLADPTTVKKSPLKYTTDATDAEFLAVKLRNQDLKVSPYLPRIPRAFRDLVRLRAKLIQDRARYAVILINMVNNQSYVRINRRAIDEAVDTLFATGEVDAVLKGVLTHHFIALKAAAYLRMVNCLNIEIERVENDIRLAAQSSPVHCHQYMPLLKTIKGCGEVLSTAIAAEIDDISRFKNAKNFVSYCRLAPTARFSNGKSKGEGNAKNGNAYLSWALTEMANLVVRFNPAAKRKFNKLLNKRSNLRCRAIRPIAAMLARAIYYMLRDNKPFNSDLLFGEELKNLPGRPNPGMGG